MTNLIADAIQAEADTSTHPGGYERLSSLAKFVARMETDHAPAVDVDSAEGMLREAHDLMRHGVERWKTSSVAWVADDLCDRINAVCPGSVDVIEVRSDG